MTDYSEFRIRIEPGQRKGQYRVEASGLAGNQTGTFKVPFRDEALENFVLKVGQTRRGVRTLESPQWDLAKTFGGKLFVALMHGPVADLYRSSVSTAQATGKGTRVTLSLTSVPELGEIPWEYLFDAPNFLAISTSTPVVRYLDVAKPPRPLEVGLPIRILGIVSAPSDFEVLDAGNEKARLTSALKPLIDANAVTIEWLEVATLTALTKKLQPDTFHILHFIGHGGFDRSSGKGALLFEDDTGRGRPISGEQLATILHDKASLRLVFLNSCEGARTSIKDPFSGVAESLIEREIPAVIAMQFEITDRAAIIFAGEFYATLAEGQPVDESVTQARLLVFADDNDVEWGTPVLFLRVADGRLFNVADASTLPRVTVDDLPPKPPATEVPPPDGGPSEPGGVEAPIPLVAAAGGTSGDETQATISGSLAAGAVAAGLASVAGTGQTPPTSGLPPAEQPTADQPPEPPEPPAASPPGPPVGEPPGPPVEPPAPPIGGPPPGGPGSGGPGSGGPGSGGSRPVEPVGPTTVRLGANARSIGIAAIAVVGVLAAVLLLGGGRLPWDGPTATAQAGGLASASPDIPTAIPTPTGVTTPPPDTPPPATPHPTTAPSVAPIKIAVEVVDRTATNSRGIIDAVRMAIDDVGGSVHGVPVSVPASVVFDDKGSPADGKDFVAKVVKDENVIAMVGPYNSTVAAAEIPVSNKAGLLQCSPSTTSESLTRPEAGAAKLRPSRPDAINFVRTVTTNEIDPVGAAIYLLDHLGRKSVYIVDNGAGSAVERVKRFTTYWEKRGAKVVGTASVKSSVTDYSGVISDAKAAGADVVYFSGSSGASPMAARLLKAMRDGGLDVPFMGSGEIFDGTTGRKGSFLNLATDVAGTGVYMSYPAVGEYPDRASFEDRFQKTYGRLPGLYAITAYACTQAILDAMSRTDLSLDRGALRDAVRAAAVDSTYTYHTAMGDFRFDENGDTTLQIITIYDFETGAKDWTPVAALDVPDP